MTAAPVQKAARRLKAAVPSMGALSQANRPEAVWRGIEERSQFLEQDWSSQSDSAGLVALAR